MKENIITRVLYVVFTGLKDSLSYHKTFPLMLNSQPIWQITLSVVAANIVVYIGGSLIYSHGVVHIVSFLSGDLSYSSIYAKDLINSIYHANWLIPICGLCYISNLSSYQSLSDYIYKYVNSLPKDHIVPKLNLKDVSNTIYGLLVWLICYIQMQLLTTFIPFIFSYMSKSFILSSSVISQTPGVPNITFMFILFQLLSAISKLMGFFIACVLYAMYGFEPFWISNDIDPDARLCILENYWAYFFGFGLPYFILFKFTPFFIGYGIYLALFPFCIMLGSISDYKQSFKYTRLITVDDIRISSSLNENNENKEINETKSNKQQYLNSMIFPRLSIFQPARKIALSLIKIFDAHIKLKRKLATKNSSNDTSGLYSQNRSNTNKLE